MSNEDNKTNIRIDHEYTLNKMLDSNNFVEIPIIQRDYAQGRTNAKEIREDFLNDIFSRLENKEKLKLNFVYGAVKNTAFSKIYIPYDGQQRITLIYLLTLYFAAYCENWEEVSKLSRFKYYTRDYATEFCSFLTGFNSKDDNTTYNNVFKRIDLGNPKLKSQLMQDIEFFGAWENDPTTDSMLVVLDAIHADFYSRNVRLSIDEKREKAKEYLKEIINGIIFFDWCTINADDNIYIKMNGRGKPLSAFDNFKNTLYSELKKLRAKDADEGRTDRIDFLCDFEEKMDGVWTDLFWSLRDRLNSEESFLIAPAMMNCLFFVLELRSAVVTNSFFFGSRLPFTWIDEKNVVSFLSNYKDRCNVADKTKSVSLDDYIWLSKFLDIMNLRLLNSEIDTSISELDGFTDEFDIFYEISTSQKRKENVTRFVLSAQTSIVASMYYEYLVNVASFDDHGNLQSINDDYRHDWLTLIGRIMKTVGHYKARFDSLQREKHIIYGYDKFFVSPIFEQDSSDGNIIVCSTIFDDEKLKALRPYFDYSHAYSQLVEEILKMQLVNEDSNKWKARIEDTEKNLPYFDNQILFLFNISTVNEIIDEVLFDKYSMIARSITDENGIIPQYQNKFTAILLFYGDYRIKSTEGFTNTYGLCSNNSNDSFDWRYFFDIVVGNPEIKCKVIKQAFDLIDEKGSIDEAYNAIKNTPTGDRWRDIIIKYPEILDHGNRHRLVHEDTKGWFLIKSNGVSKQVHVSSLIDSTNIELYGIYRECGNDDAPNVAVYNSIYIDPQHKVQCDSAGIFSVYDTPGNLLCQKSYEEVISFINNNYT